VQAAVAVQQQYTSPGARMVHRTKLVQEPPLALVIQLEMAAQAAILAQPRAFEVNKYYY
jgi:hypothetical protein